MLSSLEFKKDFFFKSKLCPYHRVIGIHENASVHFHMYLHAYLYTCIKFCISLLEFFRENSLHVLLLLLLLFLRCIKGKMREVP